jgi:hypothetical protein
MDEFDLMTELYGAPQPADEPAEDDEIQLNIRSHKTDEAFEKMFAELGGKYGGSKRKKPGAPRPDFVRNKSAEDEDDPEESEPPPADPSAPARPAPAPPVKRRPQPERKTPEQLEIERRERERRAEQELFEKREREAKEREQQFIEKIANIWNTPEFAEGGRVEMSIRTEARREIRINLPSLPVSEKQPEKEQPNCTPVIPTKSPEEKRELVEEAARKSAQDRTEKAASKKISIKKKR